MANALGFGTAVTGNVMTPQDFLQSALDQPLTANQTFQSKGAVGIYESPLLGDALIDAQLAPVSRDPGISLLKVQAPGGVDFNQQLTSPESDESVRARGLTPMSKQEFDAAQPMPGMTYDNRMTVQRFDAIKNYQATKAAMLQRAERSDHPIAGFAGSLVGGGLSPVNWVPVIGPEVRAASALRWGLAGEIGVNAADAALNTAVSTMSSASFRNSIGDQTTWADVVSQSAMGALAGAAFSGVGHLAGRGVGALIDRVRGDRGLNSIDRVMASRSVLDEAVDGLVNDDAVSLSPASRDAVSRMSDAVAAQHGPMDIGGPSRELGAPVDKPRPDWVRVVGEDPRASIAEFMQEATDPQVRRLNLVLGVAPERLVEEARKAGVDVEGYTHAMDAQFVRHILNSHGDAAAEATRGQLAITPDDFQRVPDILSNFDEVARTKTADGRPAISYLRKMEDGTTAYVEEVRAGHKVLATRTMQRWESGKGPASIADYIRGRDGSGPRALDESRATAQQTSETASATATDENIAQSVVPSNASELEPDYVEAHQPSFVKPQLDPSSSRYTGPEDPDVAAAGQNVGKPSSFETMANDYGVDITADAASAEVRQIEAENRLSDTDRLALKEADEAIAKADAWAEALKAAATCVLKV